MSALKPLPDYLSPGLGPGLKLVIVGFNPGHRSARLGHYYAGIGNLFWKGLYAGGLVPHPLTYLDDHRLPQFGIGLTDLCKRPSRASSDLPRREFRDGRAALLAKLEVARPSLVAFNGKGVYEYLTGRACRLGMQRERLFGARVFVLPSTSARNASLSRKKKLAWFRRLGAALDRIRRL